MNLYNKYKPKTMKEIVGQDFVLSILNGLIGNLPNGLIVTGAHGVGKTLLLTLLAKAINCLDPSSKLDPCYKCENCLTPQDDIVELDAATHSGVESMRNLLDCVHYMPLHLKYKVYIIDEAHMLSQSAFDALLLTLHELPDHVKIFFATTKIYKIPLTIISRCLVIQMSRINNDTMKTYIEDILKKEDKKLDKDTIDLIIKSSEGSIRQALSTLQLCLSTNNVTLNQYLKLINPQTIREIFMCILDGEPQKALDLWHNYYTLGYDEKFFMNELLHIICECTKAKLNIKSEENEIMEKYDLSVELLCNYWDIILMQMEGLNTTSVSIVEKTILMLCTVLDRSGLNKYVKGAL